MYLHISKEEQNQRLLERQEDPTKSWKLNAEDWGVHAQWDEYVEAYRDALRECSTAEAPWYIVPSDRKWFRNLSAATILVETLRPYKKDWLKKLEDMQAERVPKVRDAQRQAGF